VSSPESELSAADSMTSTTLSGLTSLQIENIIGKSLKILLFPLYILKILFDQNNIFYYFKRYFRFMDYDSLEEVMD
jgi:hypothetical protein